jgi:hypothetical protein
MGPPVSRLPWSPDFVVQSLEILSLCQRDGALRWLKPVHADSLRVGLPRGVAPGDFVVEVVGWYPLAPRLVHSTSWRSEEGTVVLTYAVVVDPPVALPPDSLFELPVERAALARGGSVSAPARIAVAAIIEHALRHLSWLVSDDPAVATVLSDWRDLLAPYQPEPFRALG